MKSWKRITLVIFVLVGGTMSFGYWSINQFNQAFDTASAAYLANASQAYSFVKQQRAELASTSPDVLGELATSTGSGQATSTDLVIASSPPVASVILATSTVPGLSFTFPKIDTEVYIGCTYQISWLASTTINSLEAALIDAGTRDAVLPNTSGLAKENTTKKESQHLNWKVGPGSPGAYYIKISRINNVAAVIRSKIFKINEIPAGSNENEQRNLCEKTGGNLF